MAEKHHMSDDDDDDDDDYIQQTIGLIKMKAQAKPDDKESIGKLLKGINVDPPPSDYKNIARSRLLAGLMPPPPPLPPSASKSQNDHLMPGGNASRPASSSSSSTNLLADEICQMRLENDRLERLSDYLQMENELIQELNEFTKHIKNPVQTQNTTKIKNMRQGAHYLPRSLTKLHAMLSRERALLYTGISDLIYKAVGFDAHSLIDRANDDETAQDWSERKQSLMMYYSFDSVRPDNA